MTAVSLPPRAATLPDVQRPGVGRRLVSWFADRGIQTKLLTVVALLGAVAIACSLFAASSLKQAGDEITTLADTQRTDGVLVGERVQRAPAR